MPQRNLIGIGATANVTAAKNAINGLKDDVNALGAAPGFKALLGMGAGLGVGAAAFGYLENAAGSAINAIFGGISAASNMNETITKSQAVFGKSADALKEWAKDAASSLGISQQAAIESAATFGNLFSSLGVGKGKVLEMSEGLVQLASDLGSFNNIDPSEVLRSLQSGLVGEVEAVRRFGIALSGASTEQKVFELGLAKTRAEITEGMKVQARYAIIMEQTRTAQGDFARTADGLANSQRTLNAMLSDVSVSLGEKFLPIMVDAAKIAKDDLIPALALVVDHVETFAKVAVALAAVLTGRLVISLAATTKGFLATGIAAGKAAAQLEGTTALSTKAAAGFSGAWSKVGSALAANFANIATVAVAGVVLVWTAIDAEIQKQGRDMADSLAGSVTTMTDAQLRAGLEAAKAGLAWFNAPDWIPFMKTGREQVVAQMDILAGELERRAAAANQRVRLAFEYGPNVAEPVLKDVNAIAPALTIASAKWAEALRSGLVQGWSAVQSTVGDLFTDLAASISKKNPAHKAMEKLGEDVNKALTKPMTGQRRMELLATFLDTSTKAGQALAKGLASNDPLLREKAEAAKNAILTEMDKLRAEMKAHGTSSTKAFADGMTSAAALAYARQHAAMLAGEVGKYFRGESPPKYGPLKEIDTWGENVGKAWAGGLAKGAKTALPEVSGPRLPGGVGPTLAGAPAMAAVGGAGQATVVHTTINLDGATIARVVDRHNYRTNQRAAPTLVRT